MLALGETGWPTTSDHRPVPHQGQERHRHLPHPARAAWRRSAAHETANAPPSIRWPAPGAATPRAHERRQTPRSSPPAGGPDHRAGIRHAVPAADRRAAVGPGHGQVGQHRHAQVLPRARHARCDAGAGRGRAGRLHQTIGLFRTKAKNAIATCRILLEQHGGGAAQELEARPAWAARPPMWCSTPRSAMAVDTHIFRVSNRTASRPEKRAGSRAQTREVRTGRICSTPITG